MKSRKLWMVPAAAGLLALLMSGPTAVVAQVPTPSPGKMPQQQDSMKKMQAMSAMMEGPHHVLAMAYGENLARFAQALQAQVTKSKTVNLDLARPAVAEMRRSFDQMKQHHQAQMAMMGDQTKPPMAMMGDQTKPPMAGMMQEMETHLTALGNHLTALESEVNASTPDPRKVSEHTTEILKLCAGMSAMHANAKPDQMK
jgi:small-conductance mechanosensitive channel